MTILDDVRGKLKQRALTEPSFVNVPDQSNGVGSMADVMKEFLAFENREPLAKISKGELVSLSLLRTMSQIRDDSDIEGFCNLFIDNYIVLGVAVDGHRSNELSNIAMGGLRMQMDLAKANAKGNKSDLEGKGLM